MSNFIQEETELEKRIGELGSNQQLIDVIEFLIKDNAFDSEFLITTVIEYIASNKKPNTN